MICSNYKLFDKAKDKRSINLRLKKYEKNIRTTIGIWTSTHFRN